MASGALYYEDYEVGREYKTASRTITETDIVLYTGLSGDFNPLHIDEEFAKTTPYGTRIAHGPLVLAITMGLMSQLGIGSGTTIGFLGIKEWNFVGPVKAGDTISATITIAEKRRASKGARGLITRTIEVVNQRGEPVQRGTTVTLVKAREEA